MKRGCKEACRPKVTIGRLNKPKWHVLYAIVLPELTLCSISSFQKTKCDDIVAPFFILEDYYNCLDVRIK